MCAKMSVGVRKVFWGVMGFGLYVWLLGLLVVDLGNIWCLCVGVYLLQWGLDSV